MAKIVAKAKGMDGVMILMTDRVVIDRPGIINYFKYGSGAKREIPLAAISEVIFQPATMFSNGAIELVRSGRASDDRKLQNKGSALKFKKNQNQQFESLKEKIFDMMNQQQPRR